MGKFYKFTENLKLLLRFLRVRRIYYKHLYPKNFLVGNLFLLLSVFKSLAEKQITYKSRRDNRWKEK